MVIYVIPVNMVTSALCPVVSISLPDEFSTVDFSIFDSFYSFFCDYPCDVFDFYSFGSFPDALSFILGYERSDIN